MSKTREKSGARREEFGFGARSPGGNPPTVEKYAYHHGNAWADLTSGGSLPISPDFFVSRADFLSGRGQFRRIGLAGCE